MMMPFSQEHLANWYLVIWFQLIFYKHDIKQTSTQPHTQHQALCRGRIPLWPSLKLSAICASGVLLLFHTAWDWLHSQGCPTPLCRLSVFPPISRLSPQLTMDTPPALLFQRWSDLVILPWQLGPYQSHSGLHPCSYHLHRASQVWIPNVSLQSDIS